LSDCIVISTRPLKTTAQMTILVYSDQNLKDLYFNFELKISSIKYLSQVTDVNIIDISSVKHRYIF